MNLNRTELAEIVREEIDLLRTRVAVLEAGIDLVESRFAECASIKKRYYLGSATMDEWRAAGLAVEHAIGALMERRLETRDVQLEHVRARHFEMATLREATEAARVLFGTMTERLQECPICEVEDSALCASDCPVTRLGGALDKVPKP